MTLEPLGGDSDHSRRRKRLIVHASHLVPYDKPYVEPEDLDVGQDATPEEEDQAREEKPPVSIPKPMTKPKTKPKTKTEDPKTTAEDTFMSDLPDHSGPTTRSKRQRAAVVNVWTLLPGCQ